MSAPGSSEEGFTRVSRARRSNPPTPTKKAGKQTEERFSTLEAKIAQFQARVTTIDTQLTDITTAMQTDREQAIADRALAQADRDAFREETRIARNLAETESEKAAADRITAEKTQELLCLLLKEREQDTKPVAMPHSIAQDEMTALQASPTSRQSSFPHFSTSYGGISSPVPVPNINIIDLALATANAACNQLPGHSKNKNDHLHPYMVATGKPAATDILIDDNVQDLVDSTLSFDKHNKVSPASVFLHFDPTQEFVARYTNSSSCQNTSWFYIMN